jgi:putative transposase
VGVLNSHRTSTPAWLIRLACTAHAGATSLAECPDLPEWFDIERRRATVRHWYQEYTEHYHKELTIEPDRFFVQISQHRGRDPAEQSLAGLKEKHRVGDAEFLVDG